MNVSQEDLAELKKLYIERYGIILTDDELKELARRLITLFGVIGKKIPQTKN